MLAAAVAVSEQLARLELVAQEAAVTAAQMLTVAQEPQTVAAAAAVLVLAVAV